MNRQQVADFIHALKTLQPRVAPPLFGNLATSEIVCLAAAVANGNAYKAVVKESKIASKT